VSGCESLGESRRDMLRHQYKWYIPYYMTCDIP
jgi:hypothetical protein